MYEIFNMGIGMVLAVGESKVKEIIHEIERAGEEVYEIGKVAIKGKHRVVFIEEERWESLFLLLETEATFKR